MIIYGSFFPNVKNSCSRNLLAHIMYHNKLNKCCIYIFYIDVKLVPEDVLWTKLIEINVRLVV